MRVRNAKVSPERSRQMSLVKGRGNKSTEQTLASLLRRARITGWRRQPKLPGRPDFAFQKTRLAVFVDGCFWHGCGKCYRQPKSNTAFWRQKVISNVARDREVRRLLNEKGWRVLRIWEHSLSQTRSVEAKLRRALTN
jgi:DNA mismatch endonuclease, patch repair protein